MVIHTNGLVIAVPVELPIDLHPGSAVGLPQVIVEGGIEGDLAVILGVDGQTALSAVEVSGFQVMHLQLATGSTEDLSDLGSASPQVVGIGPDGT